MKLQLILALAFVAITAHASSPARVVVQPSKLRQPYQGLGCGAMLYEGHITSLAARGKDDRQRQLYDDMFAKVNARYLHLMIRPTHEPQNDNDDPWTPAFDPAKFQYCVHTLAIVKAARERRPDIELLATLGTPPAWMKTNNSEGGGGKEKATLKPKLELEFAEYLWAFLAHMARNGAPVKYLAMSNECDWPHDRHSLVYPRSKMVEFKDAMALHPTKYSNQESFIQACLGNGKTETPFSVSGLLTQVLNLGTIAEYLNVDLQFDPQTKRFIGNDEANTRLAGPAPRAEWADCYKLA